MDIRQVKYHGAIRLVFHDTVRLELTGFIIALLGSVCWFACVFLSIIGVIGLTVSSGIALALAGVFTFKYLIEYMSIVSYEHFIFILSQSNRVFTIYNGFLISGNLELLDLSSTKISLRAFDIKEPELNFQTNTLYIPLEYGKII